MKRRGMVVEMVVMLLLAATTPVLAAEMVGNDTAVDRVGDWFATVGKSGIDKDSILAQRRAERAAKRAQQAMEQHAKQAEQQMHEASKGLQEGLQDVAQ